MITPEALAKSGSEHGHQVALFQWAALNIKRYPQLKWLFAVPNGFFATPAQKAKMKAEGLKPGVPDIWLPYRCGYRYGLVIELKIDGGKVSVAQSEWLDYLNSAGYRAIVCYGWEEAVKRIEEYLQ